LKTNLNEDVYFENDSVLWIASYKGIAKVYFSLRDSLNTRIKCYTREDGLCSDQVNAIIGFNGHIWLATNEGICYFKPESLRETQCEIPVYFGNVFINGVKRNPDSLDLKFNQNNLLIQFHGLYYKATSGVRYKVRLKGREPWKYTNQGFVQYFNLPAGEYEFEVAAEDEACKYASPLIKLRFVIRARFIDTVWFKGLLIFCALAIVFYIAYLLLRYQRLKAQNFIHLHKAEFKALNYQINPHFIFNVLNSIQYYILRKDSDKAVHFLNSFSILIRRIVTNSRQQYISIIEEIECLKEYMDLEKLRLDNKFDYEINIDSSINIEAKILLPMIIQPVIENAIWHGIVPSGTRGRVKVDFAYDNKNIVVTVEDNGVGLNPDWENDTKSPQHLSMAMTNVKERLKIIGDLNDDDTWYIRMLDKRAKGGNESGTLVFIRFPEIKRDLL
jgi:Histidine kinase